MTAEEFKRLQAALGWTNARMASLLKKTPQSISNYRTQRQVIPGHVKTMLEQTLHKMRTSTPTQ